MSTAQDLRTAAINDVGADGLAGAVLRAFFEPDYDAEIQRKYICNQNLRSSFFVLLVAEALDYREPMQPMGLGARCDLVSRVKEVSSNIHDIIRATERHYGIGAAR